MFKNASNIVAELQQTPIKNPLNQKNCFNKRSLLINQMKEEGLIPIKDNIDN